jgi:hypothetical protein
VAWEVAHVHSDPLSKVVQVQVHVERPVRVGLPRLAGLALVDRVWVSRFHVNAD